MSSLYMRQIAQKCPNTCVWGAFSIVSSSFAFWSEIAPENASDIFSSLWIAEGSLPASAGVLVGVPVGVSFGKTLPIFSHPGGFQERLPGMSAGNFTGQSSATLGIMPRFSVPK